MFLGEYSHSLDEKGRVVMPSKFRVGLAGGCVLTKGQERCLYVFATDRWDEEAQKVRKLPRTDRRARNYSRSFFASASFGHSKRGMPWQRIAAEADEYYAEIEEVLSEEGI